MDASTYAEALRDACLDEDIQVVGLADHSSVEESEVVREVLMKSGIVVFPGFEVTTSEKVHWVCLFSEETTYRQLEDYLVHLGKLHRDDVEERAEPVNLGGQELLSRMAELGGFCYAAHVTSRSGVLKRRLNNLWKDAGLQAAQITGRIDDLPQGYKHIVLNQDPAYKRDRPMALINAKDVAEPKDLQDPYASSFIKMTRPRFASFLMAFKDPESRVRLVGDLQEHFYSQIESISIEGGYFDGLSAEVSGHLNAIIGGRGTGKSTLLECLRYALDVPHRGKEAAKQGDEIIKANLGKVGGRVILELRSKANHMKLYKVIRRYGDPPRVIDEQGDESHLHPGKHLLPKVEIYGQNEIYELVKSPGLLTRVLDRFLPEGAQQQSQLDLAYRKLRENGERLGRIQEQKEEIGAKIARLPMLEEQKRQFQERGLEEKLDQVPLLERERLLGPRILEEVERVRRSRQQFEESLPDLVFLNDKVLEDLLHADLLRRGRELLEKLNTTLRQKLGQIDEAVGGVKTVLASLVDELMEALDASETRLKKEFARLPAVAGKSGAEIGSDYQQLSQEIERLRPAQAHLSTVDSQIKKLEQERRNLLGEISDIRSARTSAKQEVAKDLNKRLAGEMRITIIPDDLRQPLRDFLQGLSGVGEQKTKWVDEAQGLTVMGLVTAIREGEKALLDKGWGLTSNLAKTLKQMTPEQLYGLEAIDLDDRASLELNVSHTGEQYRSLDHLSIGQQCTAILHLLLLDNPDPLIMDQPEDNLDNAFIAERIVQELRDAKTKRQFLFATHNANIPVFGDAEWIGVCSSSGDHAEMLAEVQGSIDIPEIRDQVANILEGGKEAFMQRKEKYGFDY